MDSNLNLVSITAPAQAMGWTPGPYNDDGSFQLYQWSRNSLELPRSIQVDFQDMHPEAMIIYPEKEPGFQILSDDGSQQINGKSCKDLVESGEKSFRSIWVN